MIGNVGTMFFIVAVGAWREILRQETAGRRIRRALALLCDISSMLRDVCFVIPLYCLSVVRYIALKPAPGSSRSTTGNCRYRCSEDSGADLQTDQSGPAPFLGLWNLLWQQARSSLVSSFWWILYCVFDPVFGQRHVRIVRDVRYGAGPRNL